MVLAAQEIETRLRCEQRLPIEFTANDPPEPQAYHCTSLQLLRLGSCLRQIQNPKIPKVPPRDQYSKRAPQGQEYRLSAWERANELCAKAVNLSAYCIDRHMSAQATLMPHVQGLHAQALAGVDTLLRTGSSLDLLGACGIRYRFGVRAWAL